MFSIAVAICILAGVSIESLKTLAILLLVWEAIWISVRFIQAGNR